MSTIPQQRRSHADWLSQWLSDDHSRRPLQAKAAEHTAEWHPGAGAHLTRMVEFIAPRAGESRHHLRWGDDNGSSHGRAALLGLSLTVPFAERRRLLGTWQQIMLLELDARARRRE